MSIVSLQFGQCGNQIGSCLYNQLTEDINTKDKNNSNYYCLAVNKWFDINKNDKWEPRSVLIDTENKVVQFTKVGPYSFKNIVAKSFGGSANNWACGYERNGKKLSNEVLNAIRAETEKCDLLSSFLNVYSSSGGTGSGVGSYIIEQLRDAYPNKSIVNTIVLPYINGEIVTQSYNSLLTLTHLYSLADSTILFENDRLHYTCKYALDTQDVNFSHMNTIIAQQLAALYQPLGINTTSLLNNLTSHPSYKLLQIRSEPHFSRKNMKFEGSRSWKTLLTSISKQSRFDFIHQKNAKFRIKTISSTLITRGSDYPSDNDVKSLKQSDFQVPWLPKECSLEKYHQKQNFLNYDKYLAIVSNNTSVCMPLNLICKDAWNLFNHGAYLHHYKKYDIDEEFFLNSFQVLENILDSYKCI